jgi:hypothetical protein
MIELRENIYSKIVILLCGLLLPIIDAERLGYGSDTWNCNGLENDFDCEMMSRAISNNKFHISSPAPHEHDFIFVRIKSSTGWFLKCMTCDIYYCNKCGKILDSETDSISHQHCN